MAYPSFAKAYGTWSEKSQSYQVSAAWQAALGNASTAGAFLGTLLNGYLVTRFGMKKVLLGGLIVLSCFLTVVFFAPNVETLILGSFLCGFPFGIFATTAPAFASEVLPLPLRVYFTSYTNMCWIIGQLIAAVVLANLVTMESSWGYRIPFALQWVWPAFLIPILWYAPESPWHLVRCNRLSEARRSLRSLQSKDAGEDSIEQSLAEIINTNTLESNMDVGTSYADCFKGFELHRTEIACMCSASQVFSGLFFAYNSTYFYQQVGLGTRETYWLNVLGTVLALVGTLIAWFCLMPRFGRRTIFISGFAAMTTVLLLIGLLNISSRTGVAQALLTVIWIPIFQFSAGQLGWAIPAEVGSTRLRQKTVCLARDAYHIASVFASIIQPYCMNPDAWDLKGYTGFLWGTTALMSTVWAYFRLSETKGKTFDELDLLFASKGGANVVVGMQDLRDSDGMRSGKSDLVDGRRNRGLKEDGDEEEEEEEIELIENYVS